MSATSFLGSKLKIERANKHIADLKAIMETFVKTDYCHLRIEEDTNTRKNILKVESIKPLPSSIALIIGDAIHNLHTALDLMMYEIIPHRETKFPFFEKRDELVGQTQNGKLKASGAKICDLIVDTIKPYRGGNDALYGLHDLDIIDKHRLLIIVLGVVALSVDAQDENGNLVVVDYMARIRPDGRIKGFATSAKRHITNYRNPSFEVFFGKGQPFEHDPVFPTLHKLLQLVSGIVHAIEKAHLARTPVI